MAKLGWKIVGGAAAGLGAAAARMVVGGAWRVVRGGPPPEDANDPALRTVDAIVWAGASAAVVELARTAATRGAARSWARTLGSPPPIKLRKR